MDVKFLNYLLIKRLEQTSITKAEADRTEWIIALKRRTRRMLKKHKGYEVCLCCAKDEDGWCEKTRYPFHLNVVQKKEYIEKHTTDETVRIKFFSVPNWTLIYHFKVITY